MSVRTKSAAKEHSVSETSSILVNSDDSLVLVEGELVGGNGELDGVGRVVDVVEFLKLLNVWLAD